jgi:hypothetical protein
VTGLAGHAYGSWKSRESGQMWLQDFLPEDFPNIRIMYFGYDSRIEAKRETSRMIDYGRNFIQQLHNVRSSEEVLYELYLTDKLLNIYLTGQISAYFLHRTLAWWYSHTPGTSLPLSPNTELSDHRHYMRYPTQMIPWICCEPYMTIPGI